MRSKIAIVYNDPIPDRYTQFGEADAVSDVLEEVETVNDALKELGYDVINVPLVPPLDEVRETIRNLDVDIFFNLFEGFAGQPDTEPIIAGMLALSGKPFTGSTSPTLFLALDKVKSKEFLIGSGVPTPRYHVLRPETMGRFDLDFPVIVKPPAEDASHGITVDSVVNDSAALARQVQKVCLNYGGSALVEEFIDGREFNSTVMGNQDIHILSISEIVYTLPPELPRLVTFGAKWLPGDIYFENTDPVCPAEIDTELWDQVAETSLSAYRLMGCRGYARIDMRLDAEGRAKVLEVNPNPAIAPRSGAALQARSAGMTYAQFIKRIVSLALER
ncbi:MAG: ATP-grasp domain-containing protein [Dehalococcoidia bacterium]|nr:ATP-grasp domain-containing protein [Dehalococcoidia bacterium]